MAVLRGRTGRESPAPVRAGTERSVPGATCYIPKPDGKQRPLGIAALEDKIVQRAVVEVLNAIYEEDFLGFSYGFRPGRSQHDALDALATAITHPGELDSGRGSSELLRLG
ncbi:reverse transcriptase domain-containing protein [Paraburkholderia tropica]